LSDDQQNVVPAPPAHQDTPRPTKTRYTAYKLERLKCWPDVLTMIENGESASKIAIYIHGRGEYLESTQAAVESAIYYWIKRDKASVGERAPVGHVPLISSTPGRVDPLDGLNMLLAFQLDRVRDLYVSEKRSGRMTKLNNDAIRLSHDILKTMAEIDTKKRRYAPPPPSSSGNKGPGEVIAQLDFLRQTYEQRYGSSAARAIMSDESRRRILNALERVRRGNSEKLSEILNLNAEKAEELQRREERQAAEEAETIDVEAQEAP